MKPSGSIMDICSCAGHFFGEDILPMDIFETALSKSSSHKAGCFCCKECYLERQTPLSITLELPFMNSDSSLAR